MTEVPPVPDEFNSEEELKAYIDRLHDQIEFLEEELTESEKEKLELKQDLNDLEEQAAQQHETSGFSSIQEPLHAMQKRIEDLEKGYLDEDSDYGLPDHSPLNDVFGADITQDPEDFKEELEDN